MKFSYNWLKELSGTKKNVEEVADLFMTHSFEVESVEDLSDGLDKVVIGEVLTKEKHSDADRLNVAIVNVGDEELQIVCGAPNLEVGQKVPVALVGAKIRPIIKTPTDKKEIFEIKKSIIRGIESNGMICAQDELGIGTEHDGIIVLDDDAPVGELFAQYAGLDDKIIDIDILPNRGHDCLSYNGIAGEICALGSTIFNVPIQNSIKIDASIDVSIDTSNCARYIGVQIDDIDIKESPDWMQKRLKASDMQPINNIVDITNYVMLETGQPLHAFSAIDEKTASSIKQISVRQAIDNEKLILLDDTELELDSEDVVITDGEKAIALAGVMGGKTSSITDTTKNIILESASFNSTSVRFSQRKYNLQTDAAYRFERNLDPNIAEVAVVRAIELICELTGGNVTAINDVYPNPVLPWTVELSTDGVTKMLGVKISNSEIKNILERLGMDVGTSQKSDFVVTIPTRRLDLHSQEDLIEEIGRMYGYDKIKPKPLIDAVQTPEKNETRFFERTLKDVLVYGGFDEVRSYSFYSVDDARSIGLDDEAHIALMNPMNPDQAIMRRTLMPNLLHFTKKNFSYFDRVQIFEIGRIYNPTQNTLPDEKLVLGAIVASKDAEGSQFFDMKGMIEVLLDRINIGEYYFDAIFDENIEHLPHLHPSRRALIKTGSGKIIGWMGEVDKKSSKYFGLKRNRAVVCELDINFMLQEVKSENFFELLAKYPFVSRDISMKVGERIQVVDVEKLIYDAGGDLIKDVDLFDIYENVETEERSMAFRIIFGHDERTLTAQEVDEKMKNIINMLEENADIEMRK